ncbi:MAG: DUF3301 domain-containing protein [Thioalkalivibrionaceae bacterium]
MPWILAFAVAALYANDSLQQLERARRHARDACLRAEVQFLDHSVVRDGIVLRRHAGGVAIERRYRFEFATDGRARLTGRLTLLRGRLIALTMDAGDGSGAIIENDPNTTTRPPDHTP